MKTIKIDWATIELAVSGRPIHCGVEMKKAGKAQDGRQSWACRGECKSTVTENPKPGRGHLEPEQKADRPVHCGLPMWKGGEGRFVCAAKGCWHTKRTKIVGREPKGVGKRGPGKKNLAKRKEWEGACRGSG